MLDKVNRLSERTNTLVVDFFSYVLIAIALFICADVFGRFVLGSPLIASREIVVLVMPWIVCTSLAYGLIKGTHVQVTLVLDRIPLKAREILEICINILGSACFLLFIYGGSLQFWASWRIKEVMFAALLVLPWWISKLAVPVGMFLIFAQFVIYLIRSARRI
ncbi:hypothetical protein ES703_125251 [subsurface metagenome]